MKVLITGASGFVGSAVCRTLAELTGYQAVGSLREQGTGRGAAMKVAGIEYVSVGELSTSTDWTCALKGVNALVHTAARVHVMEDSATEPLAEFRRINVLGTRTLAQQAAESGVRRFVFISSVKVNGESTICGQAIPGR